MQHTMSLQPGPMRMIRAGLKTYELRLYDAKRRSIRPGDTIRFTGTLPSDESCLVQVLGLRVFPDFAALYEALPLTQCGYTQETLAQASPADMTQYYPLEEQRRHSVVAIHIRLL